MGGHHLLALISYGVLHWYAATAEVPTGTAPGQIGQMVTGQMFKALATIGQYIVPPLLLIGAVISFFKQRKRKSLVLAVDSKTPGIALRDMTWQDFEQLVGEAFRMRGFSVTETGGGGADGGVDLALKKNNEFFLVQCKQWRAYKVSVSIVRELFGVMAARGATGGFVVTSGLFTRDAKSFARGRNIELIDGSDLVAMIKKVRATRSAQTPAKIKAAPTSRALATPAAAPTCPRCNGTMVKRVAKRGTNTGGAFWGCTLFPKCRGIRNVN